MQIPGMTEKVPFSDVIEEMAFDFDIDLKAFGGLPDGIVKQKEDLLNKVKAMAGATGVQSTAL